MQIGRFESDNDAGEANSWAIREAIVGLACFPRFDAASSEKIEVMVSVISDFKGAGRKRDLKKAGESSVSNQAAYPAAALLTSILGSSPDAIVCKDLNGLVTGWNPAAARMFGYSADEITGQPIANLVPHELVEQEQANLARIGRGEAVEPFESYRVKRNGARFPVAVIISPIRNEAGAVLGAAEVVRDISELRRTEEDRFRFAAIIQSSEDAIFSTDLEGNVTSWNEAACQMFGYSADKMLGRSLLQIVPAGQKGDERDALRRLKAGEKIERFETVRVTRDGEPVEVSVTISPIKDAAGEIVGAAHIAHDISERKRMERLLIRSEKLAATGRMAATVAHEINNPLESVLNFVYLARRNALGQEKAHGYLLSAEGELDRVSQIIRRVLGYYSETGRQDQVFLHEVLAEALAVYQAQLHASGILVDCRYEDHRRISVHWNEFAQVFSTLLADSIQVLPRGATVRFDVEDKRSAEQDGIQVMIRLRAPGIERESLDRAFAPLAAVQGRISFSIGLSVARELLEKRGAQITFSSSSSEVTDAQICIFVPFA